MVVWQPFRKVQWQFSAYSQIRLWRFRFSAFHCILLFKILIFIPQHLKLIRWLEKKNKIHSFIHSSFLYLKFFYFNLERYNRSTESCSIESFLAGQHFFNWDSFSWMLWVQPNRLHTNTNFSLGLFFFPFILTCFQKSIFVRNKNPMILFYYFHYFKLEFN